MPRRYAGLFTLFISSANLPHFCVLSSPVYLLFAYHPRGKIIVRAQWAETLPPMAAPLRISAQILPLWSFGHCARIAFV
jgi:hypothetical protein